MPATQHIHRLVLIVPAARCAGLNAWIVANLDATGSDWFTPSLSATGSLPATHAWASFACTDQEADKLLLRLAQQSGVAKPAGWDTYTRAQKRAWLLSKKAAVRSAIGVLAHGFDNDGVWDAAEDRLTEMGLQVIQKTP